MIQPDKVRFETMIDQNAIQARIKAMGALITEELKGEPLICVGVLKGAFVFMADLIRAIDLPLTCEFIGVASYEGTESTGQVRLTHDLSTVITGRNVLLIEDVIDTGRTIDYLLDTLKVRAPKSLRVAAFLSKPEVHDMRHEIDYVGFEIGKEFVIGYGLDLDGYFRNVPDLAVVDQSSL